MRNLLTQLVEILGSPRLYSGTVLDVDGTAILVQVEGGTLLTVRGAAAVGDKVYVRDGVIEGPAPDLPAFQIDI